MIKLSSPQAAQIAAAYTYIYYILYFIYIIYYTYIYIICFSLSCLSAKGVALHTTYYKLEELLINNISGTWIHVSPNLLVSKDSVE